MSKYICSTVNKSEYTHCEKCPHGIPHDLINSGIIHNGDGTTKDDLCTEVGICYYGLHVKWECQCVEVKDVHPV